MNPPIVKSYDPKRVHVTFIGVPLSGYADGTFIQIRQPTQRWTKKTGADGEVARTRSNDDTHEVTLTLMQTSVSNSYLSSVKEQDRLFNTGIGMLQIVDLNGSVLMSWPQAWIREDPQVEFAKDETNRPWTFDTGMVFEDVTGGQVV